MVIIGISLELQGKILRLIETLIKEKKRLTGTIVMIKDIGPGFCWGITNKESLIKAAEYFNDSGGQQQHGFSIVEVVFSMPADELMKKIHHLRNKTGSPGILNYLKSQQEQEAA